MSYFFICQKWLTVTIFMCTMIALMHPMIPVMNGADNQSVSADHSLCINRTNDLYPHPHYNCTPLFFSCNDGIRTLRSCPYGFAFDQRRKFCIVYQKVPGCEMAENEIRGVHLKEIYYSKQMLSRASVMVDPSTGFSCDNRADGNHPDPASNCSHIFYSCSGGTFDRFSCPSPSTYYDLQTDSCQFPYHISGCGGNPNLLQPHISLFHIPEQIAALPKTPVFRCRKVADGFYGHPLANCSQVFFQCISEVPVVHLCEPGLRFYLPSATCVPSKKVAACMNDTVVPRARKTTETMRELFSCSNIRTDGLYSNPDPACSRLFFGCYGNATAIQMFQCPVGFRYSSKARECLRAHFIPECGGMDMQFSQSSVDEAALVLDCTNLADGNYADPRQNCSSVFFTCSGGNTFYLKCPMGTVYDEDINRCQRKYYVISCGGRPPLKYEHGAKVPNPDEVKLFVCSGDENNTTHPDPRKRCSRMFYSCVKGQPVIRLCPLRTMYDNFTSQCLYQKYVADCGGTKEPTAVGQANGINVQMQGGEAGTYCKDGLSDGNYVDPVAECSQRFFSCVGGVTFEQNCPYRTKYDNVTDSCRFPKYVMSCGGTPQIAATTVASTTSETASEAADVTSSTMEPLTFYCGDRVGNFPNPKQNCSQFFFTCAGEEMGILMKCPGSTFYSPELDRCMFRSQVNECMADGSEPDLKYSPASKLGGHKNSEAEIKFLCPHIGNFRDPRSICSKYYITCIITGEFIVFNCAKDTFYDAEYDKCSLYKDVPDCSGNPRPSTLKTTPGPPQSTTEPPFVCISDGNYPPDNDPCPTWFWQCANKRPFQTPCPGNQRYDRKGDWCGEAEVVEGCR